MKMTSKQLEREAAKMEKKKAELDRKAKDASRTDMVRPA